MSTDCILWQGAVNDDGYPRTRRGYVHRLVWIRHHGPIPEGMQIDHSCHNATGCHGGSACRHRRCINPEHLQLVTSRVNNLLKLAPVGWEERILTHCLRGHPRVESNVYLGRDGKRRCMACRRQDVARHAARKKARALEDAGQLRIEGIQWLDAG
jgi:hypothetical protein